MSMMSRGILSWLDDAKASIRPDLSAGLTLWALVVPQSIAYAKLAGAPSPIAGLYCIIFVLPIYALFASSRLLVPSPTTAVSATFAGFLAAMISPPEAAFSALVLGTALAFFVFAFFRLGFLTDFISKPVSLGYLSGLTIIVLVKQVPDLLGIEAEGANIFAQSLAIFQNLANTNITVAIISAVLLCILTLLPKFARLIPAGLIALLVAILASWGLGLEGRFGVEMVGALPKDFPLPALPLIHWQDLGIILPASIGLVILASGEASVTAQTLAAEHGQRVDINQQFFAFGMGNLAGGFFGGTLGTGASSASMVNETAGAKTLMSTIWAAAACLLTVLFLTGIFAYLPAAFLAALVSVSVWKMLYFKEIWRIRGFSHPEFFIALIAQISVLVFGILNGLIMSMIINVLYFAYRSSQIKTSPFGVSKTADNVLLPLDMDDAEPLPQAVLALGLTEGQIFYASARGALDQALQLLAKNQKADIVIISVERMNKMDYTSCEVFKQFQKSLQSLGKKLYITDIRSEQLMEQFRAFDFDPEWVKMSNSVDLRQL